jgi:hypothetical protein
MHSGGRRPARPLVTGVLVALGTSLAAAQSPPPSASPESLAIGNRVRGIAMSGASVDGFVRAVGADTIRVAECKQCNPGTAIRLSTLREVEVERQRIEQRRVNRDML